MSQGPSTPDPQEPEDGASGPEGHVPPPPPYSAPQGQPYPPYGGPPPGHPQAGYPQAGYPQPAYQHPGYPNPHAPYGVHPVTGVPYSDKTKLIAGLLQILIPLGIGRFYLGDNKTGAWQLAVTLLTCGIGSIWPFIDGIIILATDNVTDAQGRPLRMT